MGLPTRRAAAPVGHRPGFTKSPAGLPTRRGATPTGPPTRPSTRPRPPATGKAPNRLRFLQAVVGFPARPSRVLSQAKPRIRPGQAGLPTSQAGFPSRPSRVPHQAKPDFRPCQARVPGQATGQGSRPGHQLVLRRTPSLAAIRPPSATPADGHSYRGRASWRDAGRPRRSAHCICAAAAAARLLPQAQPDATDRSGRGMRRGRTHLRPAPATQGISGRGPPDRHC